MALDTVTSKGKATIPAKIAKKAGIGPGSVLEWSVLGNGQVLVSKKTKQPSAAQKHIMEHGGKWDGKISGAELLRRTRP